MFRRPGGDLLLYLAMGQRRHGNADPGEDRLEWVEVKPAEFSGLERDQATGE